MAWNGMRDMLTNNLAGELLGESFSGGPLNGLTVTNSYDQYLRRTNLTANATAGILVQAVYGYDGASRLQTVNAATTIPPLIPTLPIRLWWARLAMPTTGRPG